MKILIKEIAKAISVKFLEKATSNLISAIKERAEKKKGGSLSKEAEIILVKVDYAPEELAQFIKTIKK